MRLKMILLPWLLLSLSMVTESAGQVSTPNKNKIFITGAVYDSETKEPLNNARLSIHKSEKFSTQSSGKFSLFGLPGDTISYSYLGYKELQVVIPDTLKEVEYLMGVFMPRDTIRIPEVIIFPRIENYPSIVSEVNVDEKMLNQAQKNVNKATFQGLTQPVSKYDADMNAKKTMRSYETKAQNYGLLATPENSVGISTASYRTNYLQFGSPLIRAKKITYEMIRQNEIELLLVNYEIMKIDSTVMKP
ncbi:MAG TPA: hypothetical protein VN249_07695 [Prolixibacteraceae bacterium]|nr:hypothetical protein [Prolixibacteraceae bacterium]